MSEQLIPSRDLGVDLDDLRQWVKRGLCKPTARTPDGNGYLWNSEGVADVKRAAQHTARYRQIRIESRLIRAGRATSIDWVLDHTGRGVMVLPTVSPKQ